ncbi:hypothetical protein BTVI_15261 [Pitangus sulphuratus]|nr:hypothetical protein BTVI_15261 [Pitangus sulphuratus]
MRLLERPRTARPLMWKGEQVKKSRTRRPRSRFYRTLLSQVPLFRVDLPPAYPHTGLCSGYILTNFVFSTTKILVNGNSFASPLIALESSHDFTR